MNIHADRQRNILLNSDPHNEMEVDTTAGAPPVGVAVLHGQSILSQQTFSIITNGSFLLRLQPQATIKLQFL